MKYLVALILMFVTASAFSEGPDSGLYFNPERDGEGINLIRNGDVIVFYFFTYEPASECWNISIPDGGLVTEENCHEQRWFLSSGDIIEDDKVVEGWLYTAVGLGYPKCLVTPDNPFDSICGEAHIVGRYIMSRFNDGWRMIVIPFTEILDKEDALFGRVFEFTEKLLPASD